MLQLEKPKADCCWRIWPAGRRCCRARTRWPSWTSIPTQKRVYGHAKQGAAFGHTKIQGKSLLVRGLNALAATISTPLAAPVIAGTRLRGGNAGSARCSASFALPTSVATARAAGCSGILVARADSAFYSAAFYRRRPPGPGRLFSVTVRMDPKVKAAIAAIPHTAWHPHQISPGRSGMTSCRRWVSDAEVAEVSLHRLRPQRRKRRSLPGPIVRRVKDLNRSAATGQGELFTLWRYHAVFTDSPFTTLQAEDHHRDHAQVEQVFADLADGPRAHLPSGSFPANAAWLALAAISHNLLRAAGSLASLGLRQSPRRHRPRRDLIGVAARTARHGRGHITMHLPDGWHREIEWISLFEAACGPPAARGLTSPDPVTASRGPRPPADRQPRSPASTLDKPQNQ